MPDKTLNSLRKVSASLQIVSAVAGGIIAIVALLFWIDGRIDAVENAQALFEGAMDERTKNTAKRVDDIYDIVKEWGPDYAKAKTKDQR